jgi:hypothetical protein
VLAKRRGRKPRVPLAELLAAMTFHFMNSAGTLAEHFAMLFDDALADSSCASRRARLPWEVFAELMQRTLRPLAQKRRHPECFWRGWRLLAIDGSQFSLTNTPQIKCSAKKAKTRRGQAAFAKIVTSVLLEIGLHNPLAAAIGRKGESEWELAHRLLAQLPTAAVQRPGFRSTELRLWTSLLDPRAAPALELVELYAQRWEQELFYRQLKRQLRKTEVLQSHTVETGAQEIAAMLLAAALVAAERAEVAHGQLPALRISFLKLLELLRPLWLVLELGDDLLEPWQKKELTERFHEQARRCVTPRRRARSCRRAVRQPVSGWPRLLQNESWTGSATFHLR